MLFLVFGLSFIGVVIVFGGKVEGLDSIVVRPYSLADR